MQNLQYFGFFVLSFIVADFVVNLPPQSTQVNVDFVEFRLVLTVTDIEDLGVTFILLFKY
jgi:hypothetical protein